MRIYLDRGHAKDGGALDEYRQTGVFADTLQALLMAAHADVVRIPDELDSFAAQDWALADMAADLRVAGDFGVVSDLQALFVACHADVDSRLGHVFYSSPHGQQWAELVAAGMPYRCEAVSTDATLPSGELAWPRTGPCLGRITLSPLRICGVLLELWRCQPPPSNQAIREVAAAVAAVLC